MKNDQTGGFIDGNHFIFGRCANGRGHLPGIGFPDNYP
jgi:hypothetical protein